MSQNCFVQNFLFGKMQRERSPCLVHLSRRHMLSIGLSSVVKFSHFDFSETAERNYETWQEARSERPLSSLCFSGRSVKQDGRPGLWLAEIFSTSPLKPLTGIQRNLTGSKILTSSTKFVLFQADQKTKMAAWPLIGWDIFAFSSKAAELEFNETWSKISTFPTKFVFFGLSDRKNKMAALASDWLRHFQLLLWNHWPEFNKTW